MNKGKKEISYSYFIVESWMHDELHLDKAVMMVFAVIYSMVVRGNQKFFAGTEYLCNCLGLSRATVSSSLKILLDNEYIIKIPEQKYGYIQTYRYEINETTIDSIVNREARLKNL